MVGAFYRGLTGDVVVEISRQLQARLPHSLFGLEEADAELAGFRRADLAHPDHAEFCFLPKTLHRDNFAGAAKAADAIHACTAGADVDGLHALLEAIAVRVDAFDRNSDLFREARFLWPLRLRFGRSARRGDVAHDSPLEFRRYENDERAERPWSILPCPTCSESVMRKSDAEVVRPQVVLTQTKDSQVKEISSAPSFVAQGDHRIDAHCAPRGNVSGEHGHRNQQDCHRSESHRIRRGDAVEHARHQARQRERRDDSESEAKQGELRALRQDQAQYIAWLGAQRLADADFTSAL